jgi:uncharacterized protein (TIGR02246 family)
MRSDEPDQVESATPERTAVLAVVQALGDTWGRHDADAYGDLFTDDATYVTFLGTHYQGKQEIIESHRTLFATYLKETRLAAAVLTVRFPGPGVALLTGRGDTYKGPTPKKLRKVQTYVLVRRADGSWRIAAFHNTKRRPLLEAITFRSGPGLVPARP